MARLLLLASAFCALPVLADQTVTVGPSLAFVPSTVTVAPGETVTWVWAAGPHSTTSNATSGPEFWNSNILSFGASFTHTFSTPGSYPYYCAVHSSPTGTAMNGVVIVVPPATPTSTSTPPVPTPVPTPGPGTAAVPALGSAGLAAFAAALVAAAVILLARPRS